MTKLFRFGLEFGRLGFKSPQCAPEVEQKARADVHARNADIRSFIHSDYSFIRLWFSEVEQRECACVRARDADISFIRTNVLNLLLVLSF